MKFKKMSVEKGTLLKRQTVLKQTDQAVFYCIRSKGRARKVEIKRQAKRYPNSANTDKLEVDF